MKRRNDPLANLDKKPCHRRYKRRTVRVMVDYIAAGRACCEYATTLGAGGMFIQSEEPLPPDTLVKVRFRLDDEEGSEFIEMEARVAWSQPAVWEDPGKDPGMGLEFVDKVAIAEFARKLDSLP